MNAPKPQQFVLSRMRSGPIRHETLPDELLEHVRNVHERIGKYLGMNLEQFEIGFMREETPDTEVAIWKSIAMAWSDFHEKYVGDVRLPHEEEKSLLVALIAISMGVQKVEKLGVPVEVGSRLLACFDRVLEL
jgi:hypothetical protein